ncbi:hypothetical protein MVEN_00125500 [Mycena venus]|uniref:Uncharacterized protein n=1 Tax=Mycena venus TaxID=2733690 RepID=A0A8H7DEM4_9AGAR|nr:hypothetical protein MVEN_00125500 [Mycena venus]
MSPRVTIESVEEGPEFRGAPPLQFSSSILEPVVEPGIPAPHSLGSTSASGPFSLDPAADRTVYSSFPSLNSGASSPQAETPFLLMPDVPSERVLGKHRARENEQDNLPARPSPSGPADRLAHARLREADVAPLRLSANAGEVCGPSSSTFVHRSPSNETVPRSAFTSDLSQTAIVPENVLRVYQLVAVHGQRATVPAGTIAVACPDIARFVVQYRYWTVQRLEEVATRHRLHMSSRRSALMNVISRHVRENIVYDNNARDDEHGTVSTFNLNRLFDYVSIGDEASMDAAYGNSAGHTS